MTCHICKRTEVRDYDRANWKEVPTEVEIIDVFSGTERVFGCPDCETDLSVTEWGTERYNWLAGLPQAVSA